MVINIGSIDLSSIDSFVCNSIEFTYDTSDGSFGIVSDISEANRGTLWEILSFASNCLFFDQFLKERYYNGSRKNS